MVLDYPRFLVALLNWLFPGCLALQTASNLAVSSVPPPLSVGLMQLAASPLHLRSSLLMSTRLQSLPRSWRVALKGEVLGDTGADPVQSRVPGACQALALCLFLGPEKLQLGDFRHLFLLLLLFFPLRLCLSSLFTQYFLWDERFSLFIHSYIYFPAQL